MQHIFNPRTVKSVDAEPADTMGPLYCFFTWFYVAPCYLLLPFDFTYFVFNNILISVKQLASFLFLGTQEINIKTS